MFQTWPSDLPRDVEVCAIQLPGRGARLLEPPLTLLPRVVQLLAQALRPHLDIPFVFFGHSLGAFMSFELVRQLRSQNVPGPLHLFVSGQRAPQIPDSNSPIHHLPNREFIEEIQHRYNGIPQAVLQSAELMEILLPTLRADATMSGTYTYTDERPLDCPITTFGGLQDWNTRLEDLAAWRDQTCSSFTLKMLPGAHFFIHSARALLLPTVSQVLTRLLRQLTPVEARDD